MNKEENYLDKIPALKNTIGYTVKDEMVTLEIENKGIANKIAQKLLKKPKISYIHLDEFGSYAILCADGKRTIYEIGILVEEKFKDKVSPLYERLCKYFQIMDSYSFIDWK